MSPLCAHASGPEINMAEVTFCVEAVIRGYHAYEDTWTAAMDEELGRPREPSCTHMHTCAMMSLFSPPIKTFAVFIFLE